MEKKDLHETLGLPAGYEADLGYYCAYQHSHNVQEENENETHKINIFIFIH